MNNDMVEGIGNILQLQADYEALKEYLTAARGWDTYGLDIVYWIPSFFVF